MINKLFLLFVTLTSASAIADVVSSMPTKISEINSYANFPDGDTLISVDSPHSTCSGGYWLKISDIAYEKNFSILLSAFHTQSDIIFYAENGSPWPHSTAPFCQISQIKLVR